MVTRFEKMGLHPPFTLSNMFLSILTAYVKVTMTPAFWRFQEEDIMRRYLYDYFRKKGTGK